MIYFDYAATTPMDKEVFEKMKPYFGVEGEDFANPGSIHRMGQRAITAVDDARVRIAKTICAQRDQIIFTGSATEANNLMLRGAVKRFRQQNPGVIPHIAVSEIEHPSVLETARDLALHGEIELDLIPVDEGGRVRLDALERLIKKNTVVVSVQWTNNETGTEQPIHQIAELVAGIRKDGGAAYPLFHTDAVQAYAYNDLNVIKSGVTGMTLSAHKIGGPKGIGALYIQDRELLEPCITGGGQEKGLRSGTENVPLIVGFSYAAELAQKDWKKERERLYALSEKLYTSLRELTGAELNGDVEHRSAHILNVHLSDQKNLHIGLDMENVAVSAGSACSQRFLQPSHVLRAMGKTEAYIQGCIRFSFGRKTTEAEISGAVEKIALMLRRTTQSL